MIRTGAALPGDSTTNPDKTRLVSQRQAAELAGCSKDTIVRARHAHRFPHAQLHGNTWMLPLGDLIAAGLYDPRAERVTATAAEGSAPLTSLELARAQARISALEDLVARQDEELKFLRQLTTDTLTRRAS